MNGDLLRTLDAPEPCVRPRLIHSSTEGHCMVYYDKGHFCLFSVNGKMLGHLEVEDNIRVRERGAVWKHHVCRLGSVCVCVESAGVTLCSPSQCLLPTA